MAGQQQGLKIATEIPDTLLKNRVVVGWRHELEPAAIGSEAEVEERQEGEGSTNPGLSQTVSSLNQGAHLVGKF